MDQPKWATVDDLFHVLDHRYGMHLSQADVMNQLREIKRKPRETLHTLYDRVKALVRKADMPEDQRAYRAREAFFGALQTNRKLQHYVGRYDNAHPPNIDLTLALAIKYEFDHGCDTSTTSSVHNVEVDQTSQCSESEPHTDTVNQLMFQNLSTAKDPLLKKIGKTQNEMIEMYKEQHKLLSKHLEMTAKLTSGSSGKSHGGSTSSKYHSNKSSSSGSKQYNNKSSSSNSGNKSTKPWNKNKFNKSNKSGDKRPHRERVNECNDQPEQEDEGPCESGQDEEQHSHEATPTASEGEE